MQQTLSFARRLYRPSFGRQRVCQRLANNCSQQVVIYANEYNSPALSFCSRGPIFVVLWLYESKVSKCLYHFAVTVSVGWCFITICGGISGFLFNVSGSFCYLKVVDVNLCICRWQQIRDFRQFISIITNELHVTANLCRSRQTPSYCSFINILMHQS